MSGLELRPRWGEVEGDITNQTDLLAGNTITLTWVFSGNILTGTEIDGFRTISATGNIERVSYSLGDRGNNGNNIVDLNKGTLTAPFTNQQNAVVSTTMYTTQANRPTLAGLNGSASDNAFIDAPLPDIVAVDIGDVLSVDVDNSVALDRDMVVRVLIRFTET